MLNLSQIFPVTHIKYRIVKGVQKNSRNGINYRAQGAPKTFRVKQTG